LTLSNKPNGLTSLGDLLRKIVIIDTWITRRAEAD